MTDGINNYLKTLEAKGYAAGTIRYQRNHLENFQKYLYQQSIAEWSGTTTQTIISYLATLTDRNLKRTTVISQLNALRQFFAYLCRQNQTDHNPTLKIEVPKPQRTLSHVPTEAEVQQILAVPDLRTPIGIRDRAILELLYSTGLRRQEAVNLNLNDVDLENGQVFVNQGKNYKDRMVPLGETAAKFIEAYLKLVRWWFLRDPKETALFIDSQKGSRLHPFTMNHIVSKTVSQSRIAKRITPHTFRHAMATHLLQNQADIRHIQLMLGHNSVETTEIYTRLAIDDLKAAYHQAHPHARNDSHLNPDKKATIDLMKNWVQVDNAIYESNVFKKSERFYMLYTHPIHKYKNKLYITNKQELISFMKDHINPDKFDGLDLIIASQDFLHIIICNHDGEIFIATKDVHDGS